MRGRGVDRESERERDESYIGGITTLCPSTSHNIRHSTFCKGVLTVVNNLPTSTPPSRIEEGMHMEA